MASPTTKAKHAAEAAKGKVKEITGKATGNKKMTASGKAEKLTAGAKHATEKGASTVKHTVQAAKGKTKEAMGKATGHPKTEAKGMAEKVKARAAQKINK